MSVLCKDDLTLAAAIFSLMFLSTLISLQFCPAPLPSSSYPSTAWAWFPYRSHESKTLLAVYIFWNRYVFSISFNATKALMLNQYHMDPQTSTRGRTFHCAAKSYITRPALRDFRNQHKLSLKYSLHTPGGWHLVCPSHQWTTSPAPIRK